MFFFVCKNYGTTSRLPLLFWFALLYYERRGTQKGKEKRPRRGEQNLKWAGNLNSAPRLSFFVCKNHTQNYVRKTWDDFETSSCFCWPFSHTNIVWKSSYQESDKGEPPFLFYCLVSRLSRCLERCYLY